MAGLFMGRGSACNWCEESSSSSSESSSSESSPSESISSNSSSSSSSSGGIVYGPPNLCCSVLPVTWQVTLANLLPCHRGLGDHFNGTFTLNYGLPIYGFNSVMGQSDGPFDNVLASWWSVEHATATNAGLSDSCLIPPSGTPVSGSAEVHLWLLHLVHRAGTINRCEYVLYSNQFVGRLLFGTQIVSHDFWNRVAFTSGFSDESWWIPGTKNCLTEVNVLGGGIHVDQFGPDRNTNIQATLVPV
jgi:hypothetical protein